MNLRDRDNLRIKDKGPVPKVSFVRRLDCICMLYTFRVPLELMAGTTPYLVRFLATLYL